jgi:cyclophilin family peptidyl-prolyl cis-trans isomerase
MIEFAPSRAPSSPVKEKESMSNQKRARKSGQQAARKDPNANIQLAALVVIILVLAGIIWAVLANMNAAQKAPPIRTNAEPDQYSSAPPMQIDPSKNYTALVKMAGGGEFTIQLHADKAPIAVNNFVFLAREGFYDGVTFHRVLEGFMAQGGDPTGTGMGGPGYTFVNEDSDLGFSQPGVVAMANAGRDTNGSQFFITFAPVERLNGGYTIFGQVTEGMDVVNAITRRDPEQNPPFAGEAIASVTITEE